MTLKATATKALSLALLAGICGVSAAAATEEKFTLEPFGTVTLYHQTARPTHVVLFVSGDGGWKLGVVDMARELAAMDALVVGVDITHYIKTVVGAATPLAATTAASSPNAANAANPATSPNNAGTAGAVGEVDPSACFDPAKDFAALGKAVEERLGYPDRRVPILVGYSSGATLVYAALVQAPPHSFAGALSLGFCPDLIVNMPICKGNGLTWKRDPHMKGVDFQPSRLLEVPWIAMQGDIDKICTPEDTRTYVAEVPHGELVWLHKVGHGFSVPKNWMPQFKASFAKIERSVGQPATPPPAPR